MSVCCDIIALVFLALCDSVHPEKPHLQPSPQAKHRVQFHLTDNTPADHLIGSLLPSVPPMKSINRVILSADSWFRLTLDGDLYTRIALDRDKICHRLDCCQADFCHIALDAYLFDTGPNPSTVHIDLFVADENDNAPTFPHTPQGNLTKLPTDCAWLLEIPESATVGSRYALPAASDQDSARFGVSHYRLLQSNLDMQTQGTITNPFSLIVTDEHTSEKEPELRLDHALDRETRSTYNLALIAEDAGLPALSSTLKICIRIQDVNDNPPVFQQSAQTANVITLHENVTAGTVIGRFVATDQDDGPNQDILYTIDWTSTLSKWNQSVVSQVSSKYSINPQSGELRVLQALDFENEPERVLNLVIKATDGGSPKLSATTSLTISLLDVNDNDPRIELLRSDEERGVTDGSTAGGSSEPATKLEGTVSGWLENDPEPQLLTLIMVTDVDTVSAGRVRCQLDEQHRADFTLTAYSATMYGLANARAFDYEQEANPSGNVAVRIICLDDAPPRRTAERWIQVKLVDINDNWPQFDRSNYQLEVEEDVEVGYRVGQIYATDADSGPGGQVTYEMSADNVDHLQFVQIDPDTGMIYTLSKLDREKFASLSFRVTAKDGGGDVGTSSGVKTNTTSVTITVLDVNDNAPVYLGPRDIRVTEGIPIGSVVHRLEFIDYDAGQNGSVRLSLIDPSDAYSREADIYPSYTQSSAVFAIHDQSKLVTCATIDRETQAVYLLTLLATDQGVPVPLSATVSLTIHVGDVNDNHPELIYPKNQSLLYGNQAATDWIDTLATVPLDTPTGTLVAVIHGKDADSGENGTVSYALAVKQSTEKLDNDGWIMDGFEFFQLDSMKGYLTTGWGERRSSLQPDRNASDSRQIMSNSVGATPIPGVYAIHVDLCDNGSPRLCTPALFYINVSEATGSIFGFGLFGGVSLSNTVMLVLIMVCSFALIMSLVAAIVWVRVRKDGPHQPTTNGPSVGNGGGYFGPTVICHGNEPNGFCYPSYFPAIHTGTDYDPQGMMSEKDFVRSPVLIDSCVEIQPLMSYAPPDGTLRPGCVSSTHAASCDLPSLINIVTDPHQRFSTYQGTEFEHVICPNSAQTLWVKNDGEQPDQRCITFGQSDMSVNPCQTTTNSAAESDSGVDSGTGVMGINLGPLWSSNSASFDGGGNWETSFAPYTRQHLANLQNGAHASLSRAACRTDTNANSVLLFKSPLHLTIPRPSTAHDRSISMN